MDKVGLHAMTCGAHHAQHDIMFMFMFMFFCFLGVGPRLKGSPAVLLARSLAVSDLRVCWRTAHAYFVDGWYQATSLL